ncbi:MAG: rRNA adenine N-6-methyltransferase family protein [Candidatus Pacearchaeota archaeon]|jgi:16S rRNA G966 N2-methylase RsmD
METIFDFYTDKEILEKLNKLTLLIEEKNKDEDILKKCNYSGNNELLDIAKARIKSKISKDKYVGEVKYFNLNDLRFSTPLKVAEYRAKRISSNTLVDLCSGIGIQSAAFSKHSKNVFAIELDPRKVVYSKKNFNQENLKFIQGDVLSEKIIEEIRKIKPDIIFCDPERLDSEKERNLESIKPSINDLIKIYSKITENICLELPPQISLEKLGILGDFEVEYLSFNNKLNRMNLYFGKLKKCKISVADVSGERIENNKGIIADYITKPLRYIYESSSAIEKAGLIEEFAFKTKCHILENTENGKVILTSEKVNNSPLIKAFSKTYEVVGITNNFKEILSILTKLGFGKVLLKYNIDPSNYWKERNRFEKNLKGTKEATLFKIIENNKEFFIISKEKN